MYANVNTSYAQPTITRFMVQPHQPQYIVEQAPVPMVMQPRYAPQQIYAEPMYSAQPMHASHPIYAPQPYGYAQPAPGSPERELKLQEDKLKLERARKNLEAERQRREEFAKVLSKIQDDSRAGNDTTTTYTVYNFGLRCRQLTGIDARAVDFNSILPWLRRRCPCFQGASQFFWFRRFALAYA